MILRLADHCFIVMPFLLYFQVWRFNKTIFELEVCCAGIGIAFVVFSVAIKNLASHAPTCAFLPRFLFLSLIKACLVTLRKNLSSTRTPLCAAVWYVLCAGNALRQPSHAD